MTAAGRSSYGTRREGSSWVAPAAVGVSTAAVESVLFRQNNNGVGDEKKH